MSKPMFNPAHLGLRLYNATFLFLLQLLIVLGTFRETWSWLHCQDETTVSDMYNCAVFRYIKHESARQWPKKKTRHPGCSSKRTHLFFVLCCSLHLLCTTGSWLPPSRHPERRTPGGTNDATWHVRRRRRVRGRVRTEEHLFRTSTSADSSLRFNGSWRQFSIHSVEIFYSISWRIY